MTLSERLGIGFGLIGALVVFYLLRSVLTPFLVAAFLAYLGDPLVNLLVRYKFSRTWAATLVFLMMSLVIFAFFFFLIPLLTRQITVFINRLPEMILWFQQNVIPWVNEKLNISVSFDVQDLKNIITEHWQKAGGLAKKIWEVFSQSGIALLAWFAKLLLVPVVMFYLLRDWDQVIEGIRQLLPRRMEPKVTAIAQECDSVLGAFLRGQLLVMLGLAIFYSIGLALVGLDLALLLGSVVGILAMIPYLGAIVGILAAGIASLVQFHDTTHLIYVGIVFLVGHFVENFVLTPLLVGDRIGIHPVAVIFAILAGGHLFGFMGVLLALPVAAVIMVLLRHLRGYYVTTGLYGKKQTVRAVTKK